MECLKDVCEIISGFSAVIAIVISILLYKHGVNRERKIDTLRKLSEIRKNYFNTKILDKKEKLQYLNELEFFATGINEKIYDIRIVNKMSGGRLISQYDNWASDFIEDRKENYGNEKTYSEYQKMIHNLKELRK